MTVSTNGIWVMTMVKAKAGSKGPRRSHSSFFAFLLAARTPGSSGLRAAGFGSVAMVMRGLFFRGWHSETVRRLIRGATWRWTDRGEPGEVWGPCLTGTGPHTDRLLVLVPDLGGRVLPGVQGVVHRAVSGDDRREVFRHGITEGGELRDVDELDTHGRPRLDAGVRRVGVLQGLQRRRGERCCRCRVVRVLVQRRALPGRNLGPSQCVADEVLVVLGRRPGDELPRGIRVGNLLLHRP